MVDMSKIGITYCILSNGFVFVIKWDVIIGLAMNFTYILGLRVDITYLLMSSSRSTLLCLISPNISVQHHRLYLIYIV